MEIKIGKWSLLRREEPVFHSNRDAISGVVIVKSMIEPLAEPGNVGVPVFSTFNTFWLINLSRISPCLLFLV